MIDMNTIYYIIGAVLILIIGYLIAYVIHMHHRNMDIIRDGFHSIAEDIKVITEDLKEMNIITEDYNRKAEDINRKLEEK